MKTIAIRDLRAPLLHQLGAEKSLAGITDNRVLVGVFTPIDREWLMHVLTQNHSRVLQSVRDGEKELDNLNEPHDVRTLDDRLKEAAERDDAAATRASDADPAGFWDPRQAVQPVVQPLLHALSTVRNMASHQSQEMPPVDARTIKIGDISAAEIRAAADASQMLVVTDRRQLVGIIVPITQQLVAHLIEGNLSRVKRSVAQGEHEYQSGSAKTLAEVLSASVGI
jgi:hypothetical protein